MRVKQDLSWFHYSLIFFPDEEFNPLSMSSISSTSWKPTLSVSFISSSQLEAGRTNLGYADQLLLPWVYHLSLDKLEASQINLDYADQLLLPWVYHLSPLVAGILHWVYPLTPLVAGVLPWVYHLSPLVAGVLPWVYFLPPLVSWKLVRLIWVMLNNSSYLECITYLL